MVEKFDRGDFLEVLFGTRMRDARCFILVRTVEDSEVAPKVSNRFYADTVGLSSAGFPPNRHVFFGVCPRQRMDPGKEHIRYITALWASLDIGPAGYSGLNSNFAEVRDARKAVDAFPLEPSIVVQSGHGFHLYWLLDSPKRIADVEIVENLLTKLNNSFRCYSTVGMDSVLRLPGTWNPKAYETPAKCFVEKLDPGLRYGPRDFQALSRVAFAVANATPILKGSSESIGVAGKGRESILESAEPADSRNPKMELDPVILESGFRPAMSEIDQREPTGREHVAGLADQDIDRIADRVADRLSHSFLNDFFKRASDEIVERVIAKLTERVVFLKPNK